jgi:uncharacterized membrane protein YkvA (DUF1232 family)
MSELVGFPLDDGPPVPRRGRREILAEVARSAPNLVKLLYRLMRDPRVPLHRKMLVGGAGLYLVSPFDLVPEMLFPVLGQLDDLVLVVFSVHYLLRGADEDTVAEYWDGSQDALELVAALLEWGSELVPAPLRKALSR